MPTPRLVSSSQPVACTIRPTPARVSVPEASRCATVAPGNPSPRECSSITTAAAAVVPARSCSTPRQLGDLDPIPVLTPGGIGSGGLRCDRWCGDQHVHTPGLVVGGGAAGFDDGHADLLVGVVGGGDRGTGRRGQHGIGLSTGCVPEPGRGCLHQP